MSLPTPQQPTRIEDAVKSYSMYLQWNEKKQTHVAMCGMDFKDGEKLVFSLDDGPLPKIVQGWLDACADGGG